MNARRRFRFSALRRAPGGRPGSILSVLAVVLATAAGCAPDPSAPFQGYLEAEYVYVGAPVSGLLLERPVNRGDTVRIGNKLFELEAEAERAAVSEVERRLAQAEARLENLRKGRRPTELEALSARVAQQQAAVGLWEAELTRRQVLRREEVISESELDQFRSQRDAARAALDSARAELATARLGAREDEIRAAEAELAAATAAVARARWALDQKTQRAPTAGEVHEVLFRPGEFVATGAPVVVLLPPTHVKVRFFVSQARLAEVPPGREVEVRRDGAEAPVRARVSYVSTQPEFTPPVIYSRETRAKLVFMVEAAIPPEAAATLRPGQPVDVRPVLP